MKMKFLIQTCDGKVVHDFAFTLLQSIEFKNWLRPEDKIRFKFKDTIILSNKTIAPFEFKSIDKTYIPVGSVEFVTMFLQRFYNNTPKPVNVPQELFSFCCRNIFNGTHEDLDNLSGKWFIKSNDKIKGMTGIVNFDEEAVVPLGNYQISEEINIESEWRAFVYKGKLVGLQNYCGEFTMFPDVDQIKFIINRYKSAPIAYTLDVGVHDEKTFVIEVHDFFSCGLYGFANYGIYPSMLFRWFYDYVNNLK